MDLKGAQALLDLLERIHEDQSVSESELEEVLAANAFFIDFYSQWEGIDRESIMKTMFYFNQQEKLPSGTLLNRLAEGFRQATDEMDTLRSRLSWLKEINTSDIAERVLAFLPANTPLKSVIHITVDFNNNAFVYRNEMGVSLLKGAMDIKTFEDAVAHELHHVGFRFWSAQDPIRNALVKEQSGRAIAVKHVQNLLFEGMANYYITPTYVFRGSPEEPPENPFQNRLSRLQMGEEKLFVQAEAILATSLAPEAEYKPCWEAFKTIAFDMEEALLPAGHYLGARMVQTMDQIHPRNHIVRCIRYLNEFLPLYNEASWKVGGFSFNPQLVDQFVQLWDTEEKNEE